MNNIERQINKLIKEIEKCVNKYEKLKTEYGIHYQEWFNGEKELMLSSVQESATSYYMEKEVANVFPSSSMNLEEELESIESKYEDKSETELVEVPHMLKEKNEYWYSYTEKMTELLFDTFESLKKQTRFLISLLEKNKQPKLEKKLTAVEVEMIQAKEYITVQEFTILFRQNSAWQKNRRGRLRDHLPHIKLDDGGSIMYNKQEVKTWLDNNNISRR